MVKTARIVTWLSLCSVCGAITRADDWPQWLGPERDSVWRETGIVNVSMRHVTEKRLILMMLDELDRFIRHHFAQQRLVRPIADVSNRFIASNHG